MPTRAKRLLSFSFVRLGDLRFFDRRFVLGADIAALDRADVPNRRC